MIATLANLFAPHDPAVLRQAMIDRRRFRLHTDREHDFARLVSWEAFNALVTAEHMLDGTMRIIMRDQDVVREMAVPRRPLGHKRTISPPSLHELARQGASVVVNNVPRLLPRVSAVAAQLERWLRCRVNANLYASFERQSAFKPHFDPQGVLVMQLHGTKRWFLHGCPFDNPLRLPEFVLDEPPPIEEEIVLAPGDLLYLPRGEVHHARMEGGASMHLTISISPPRLGEVLGWLASRAEREGQGRRDILPFSLPDAAELRAALHRLVDALDMADFLAAQDASREIREHLQLGLTVAPDTLVQPALLRPVPVGA
jgi:ribosomal protein L16 Arg81 hydroxylase